MKLLFYAFFFMFLSCTKDEINTDPVFLQDPRLQGRLESFIHKSPNGTEEYVLTYEDLKLVSFSKKNDGGTKTYTLVKENDRVAAIMNENGEKEITFQYSPNGVLKLIGFSTNKSERIELNNAGKWEYYYEQELIDGSTVYSEIRRYDWANGVVKTQVINRPGRSFEEEDFSYQNEVNPFLSFFKEDWPIPLGREAYFITDKYFADAGNNKLWRA